MLIVDLDKILTEKKTFKLHGNIHEINPLTTEQLFRFSGAFEALQVLTREDYSSEFVIQKIYELFKVLCESITIDDVKKMNPAQVAALASLIIETITGRDESEYQKTELTTKKKVMRD